MANFVGTLNVLEGKVVDPATGAVDLDGATVTLNKALAKAAGASVALALRPEAAAVGRRPGRDGVLSGTIRDVSFLGSVVRVRIDLGRHAVSLDMFNDPATPPPVPGDKVEISFAPSDVLVLED